MERFKSKKKNVALNLKLEKELKDELESWAKGEGVSMSEYIRTLLIEEKNRIEKKKLKLKGNFANIF